MVHLGLGFRVEKEHGSFGFRVYRVEKEHGSFGFRVS